MGPYFRDYPYHSLKPAVCQVFPVPKPELERQCSLADQEGNRQISPLDSPCTIILAKGVEASTFPSPKNLSPKTLNPIDPKPYSVPSPN